MITCHNMSNTLQLNNFENKRAEDYLKSLPDNCIDLTITSPPYDDLRNYKGDYDLDLDTIIKELYRTTKKGGICVWVVNDQTKSGSETLSSFRQAIKFNDAGWRVHDTMIYKKLNPPPNAGTRYQQCFEYMFVFSKGQPKTTNIELRERRNKCNDKRTYRKKKFSRDKDGVFNENDYFVKEFVPDDNIWEFYVGGGNSTKDKIAFKHPAIFPEKLVERHIKSWTNEGDVVCDIMAGSGTTLKIAKKMKRNWIGCEPSQEYCEIIKERINLVT